MAVHSYPYFPNALALAMALAKPDGPRDTKERRGRE